MKCLWTDSQTHPDSCRNRKICRGCEELVVLEEGEKVVIAVGRQVGRVQV